VSWSVALVRFVFCSGLLLCCCRGVAKRMMMGKEKMRWGRVWQETCMRWREHRLNNQFCLSMRHSYSTQGDTAHTNRPRPFSLPPLACFACASQELGTRQTGKRSLSIQSGTKLIKDRSTHTGRENLSLLLVPYWFPPCPFCGHKTEKAWCRQ